MTRDCSKAYLKRTLFPPSVDITVDTWKKRCELTLSFEMGKPLSDERDGDFIQ